MDDEILSYYERELTFIREMGAEFARKYPKIAGRLLLEPDKCEDPHIERLIEAFAFLSGRIHKKIDDDFPEITESLLAVLYPHYTNPIPSMSIAAFDAQVQSVPPAGYQIARDTMLYSKPIDGVPCQFATCYPVTLWPVEVVAAGLRDPKKVVQGAQHAVAIQLKTANKLSFSKLPWESIRFFLNGQGQHIYHLYELLCNNVCSVELESRNTTGRMETISLAPENIRPVGFHPDERMIPFPRRSFPGHQILLEYFSFPEKFLFIDITGLNAIPRGEWGDTLEIWIYFNRIAKPNLVVDANTFVLHAAPVVNLFKRIAEPIRVEEEKTEYQIIPDIRRRVATEIFSIESVTAEAAAPDSTEKPKELRPLYSLKHHLGEERDATHETFWSIQRRPSGRKGDNGTELFLSFTDGNSRPFGPDTETVTVHVTCSNRDLPERLPFGDPAGDFEMEKAAPVSRITCVVKPTPTRRPPLGGGLQWRLISQLSLNYLSLVQGGEDALKEILKLYDFDNSPSTRQQINGIVSLQARSITRRIGRSFCRGMEVTVEFDENKFVGTGLYLFASVLENFLGQYVSINSFSQLTATTLQKKEKIKTWPPRSGNRIIL